MPANHLVRDPRWNFGNFRGENLAAGVNPTDPVNFAQLLEYQFGKPVVPGAAHAAAHGDHLLLNGSSRTTITLPDDTTNVPFHLIRATYIANTFDFADSLISGSKCALFQTLGGHDFSTGVGIFLLQYDVDVLFYRADLAPTWQVIGPACLARDPTWQQPTLLNGYAARSPSNTDPPEYRIDANRIVWWRGRARTAATGINFFQLCAIPALYRPQFEKNMIVAATIATNTLVEPITFLVQPSGNCLLGLMDQSNVFQIAFDNARYQAGT